MEIKIKTITCIEKRPTIWVFYFIFKNIETNTTKILFVMTHLCYMKLEAIKQKTLFYFISKSSINLFIKILVNFLYFQKIKALTSR